ncbi:4-oxalocrotonate tautomerase [Lysinibacillus sp. 2017]|uniref:4-oxalocrotonate tautomerase n=1 Tax=unclassified Lysinibacillus TaxID=2636778 RepID=UPI000D52A1F1|nr:MULTISPECIES: 4-oxalocrotonate tautomerase [unclassified Lysinibacillus]AWE06185.1 4-oxalocrotonate tautomerase [Lysinibacillus sp. 2017]TGN35163.1 4-oxalocrotonate tautomerase [Lysinibacillus sp. S2017]
MPIVQIQLLEGRSAEQKRRIIYEMTETLAQVADVPKESIRIIIQEIPLDHWGIAGETMTEFRKNKG